VAPARARPNAATAPVANAMIRGPCFNCHKSRHLARDCPYLKKQWQPTYPAHVHDTLMEEIPEGEPVTASMFPVNQHLAVVLFNSRSSHSFISQTFAQKHDQLVAELNYGYRISSAGADVLTNWMVHGATLDIGDLRFWVNLVFISGLVFDVIIGMN